MYKLRRNSVKAYLSCCIGHKSISFRLLCMHILDDFTFSRLKVNKKKTKNMFRIFLRSQCQVTSMKFVPFGLTSLIYINIIIPNRWLEVLECEKDRTRGDANGYWWYKIIMKLHRKLMKLRNICSWNLTKYCCNSIVSTFLAYVSMWSNLH